MPRFFQKIFLFLKIKKTALFAVLFLTFSSTLLPLNFCQAGVLGWVSDLAISFATALPALMIQLFVMMSYLFMGLSAAILEWVISPGFISLKFTDNPFVNLGWTLTRDFANMGFVIALVAIGLGTALRIGEYQVKKTLPILIIVALLINFTPVICGVVIDASNIIMNFFLTEISGTIGIRNMASELWASITNLFTFFLHPQTGAEILGKAISLLVFNLMAGVVFLLFALLFIMRYIALWLLVILSPLAFFALILPGTKRFFLTWRAQFIQWAFVGVFGAFFLYLGNQLLAMIMDNKIVFSSISSEPIAGVNLSSWLNTIFPYGMVLAFLMVGFFASMSAASAVPPMVMGFAKKGARMLGKIRGVQRALGKGAELGAKGLEGTEKKIRGLEEFARKVPVVGKALKPMAKGAMFTTSMGLKAASSALSRYSVKAREYKLPGEFSQMTPDEQTRYIEMHIPDRGDRLKAISQMVKDNTLRFSPRAQEMASGLLEKSAASPYYKKEVGDIADALAREITFKAKLDLEVTKEDRDKMEKKMNEMAENIKMKITPELDEEILKEARRQFKLKEGAVVTDEMKEKAIKNIAAGAVHTQELKPGDVESIIKSSLTSVAGRFGSHGWTQGHLQRLASFWDTETVDKVFSGPGGLNTIIKSSEDLDKFAMEPTSNRLIRFFASTPAGRQMGWSGLDYMTNTEGKLTTRFKDFEARYKGVIEKLAREPVLMEYMSLRKETSELEQSITKAEKENIPREKFTEAIERLKTARQRMEETKKEIEANERLRNLLENIEKKGRKRE